MKRSGKIRLLCLLVALLIALSLAACGGTSATQETTAANQGTTQASTQQKETGAKEVTISFTNWVTVEEGTRDKVIAVIADFEKSNPGIKVETKGIPVSDISSQIAVMCSANTPPDVSQLINDTVFTHAASGFLEPVDSLASPEFLSDIPQGAFDSAGLYEGKHYALPWAISDVGFWYNKKLLQQAGLDPNKPPKTLEELDAAVAQAKTKLPAETIMLQLDTTVRTIGLSHQWPFMLAFNDGVAPVEGNKVSFNTAGIAKYGEWIRKQVKEGNTLPGKKYGEFRPMAAQDRLLFAFDASLMAGIMKSLNTELTDEDIFETWGVAAIPAGANGKNYTAPSSHCLVTFKGSDKKDAAIKFMEYMIGSEYSLTEYILPTGYPPVTKSAVALPQVSENPIIKGFMDQVLPAEVSSLPVGPDYSKTAEIIMAAVQEFIVTDKPVQDIINAAQTKLEEIYK